MLAKIRRRLGPDGEIFLTFSSTRNPSFSRTTHETLEPNTIRPTEGREAGIPHYCVDEARVWRLPAGTESGL